MDVEIATGQSASPMLDDRHGRTQGCASVDARHLG
jgi:hypothetical protein